MPSLTQTVQQQLIKLIKPGDHVIDATAGNGHDTLFLAQSVGKEGQVFAFDIQQQAIDNTRQRLREHQAPANVKLICDSHANMQQHLQSVDRGRLTCIMFNLGYLPGADKNCITRTSSTLAALQQSTQLLAPTGVLSVMLYPGHRGGDKEANAVLNWSQSLMPVWQIRHLETPGPIWLGLSRMQIPN